MIERSEIRKSLNAAWRVFLDKPDALRDFDASVEGFWRSFQAILLVAPLYFIIALGDREAILTDAVPDQAFSETAFWAAQVVTLLVDWVTLPLLLAAVAGWIGVRREYPLFIVARNWATPIMVLPAALATLLDTVFGLAPDAAVIPALLALAFSLRFSYLIASRALKVRMDVAIGIVVLDVLVSLGIVHGAGMIFGVDI